MRLTDAQLREFEENGLLILPGLFSREEATRLKAELPRLFADDSEANVREKSSGLVRTAMGLHRRNDLYDRLVRDPRIVEPAQQLAGPDLYAQQAKVNVKGAFDGEAWQWHYDFATHHHDDGVPRPLALNLHVFLDDVTDFNGPLYFVPGSHRYGAAPAGHDTTTTSYPLWVVERDTVRRLVDAHGMVSATGPAGTGLIFGDLMLHCSPPNLSPYDRSIFSLILNPVDNAYTRSERPDHKHHRDLTPVRPLAQGASLVPEPAQ